MFGLTFRSTLPPPTEKHQNRVARLQMTDSQPCLEHRRPSFVVHPRRQLRNVVGRRIRLNSCQFAEIVDRMRGIACTAADAQDEQAAGALANLGQKGSHPFDRCRIQSARNLFHFSKKEG